MKGDHTQDAGSDSATNVPVLHKIGELIRKLGKVETTSSSTNPGGA